MNTHTTPKPVTGKTDAPKPMEGQARDPKGQDQQPFVKGTEHNRGHADEPKGQSRPK